MGTEIEERTQIQLKSEPDCRAFVRGPGGLLVARSMFQPPSIAEGAPTRISCEAEAKIRGCRWQAVAAEVLHQARIDYLIGVGSEEALAVLQRLTPGQIAKLCRRMPPFIVAKLEQLKAGGSNIDTNPTGAFDTNGWPELRTRLPKFRATLAHFARQVETSSPADVLGADELLKLRAVTQAIIKACDLLLEKVATFQVVGQGRSRKSRLSVPKAMDWRSASTRLGQVLGVLKKTNRDLRSEHWKLEWKPSTEDLRIVVEDVNRMREAAVRLME